MKTYAEYKKIVTDHNREIVMGICFVLVFVVGFGTGRYEREANSKSGKGSYIQSNYTTKPAAAPINKEEEIKGVSVKNNVSADTNCVVKGNISASGKKIYHVQGGAFYKTVKPEQCFNTEDEALAAGFVKSSR